MNCKCSWYPESQFMGTVIRDKSFASAKEVWYFFIKTYLNSCYIESLSTLTIPRDKEGILLLNNLRHYSRQKILTCEKECCSFFFCASSFLHNHHLDRKGKGNATTLSLAPTASSSPSVPPRTDGTDRASVRTILEGVEKKEEKGEFVPPSLPPRTGATTCNNFVHFVRSYVRCCWYKRGNTKKIEIVFFSWKNHNFAPMGDDVTAG